MENFDLVLEQAKSGSLAAFEELCQIKGKSIIYMCIKYMGNFQDGEDAAQEVFIRLQKNIHSLKDVKAFNGWMYAIIKSTCENIKRKNEQNQKNLPIDEFEDRVNEQEIEPSPEDCLEKSEEKKEIIKAIDELPQNMKMCVILFYYEGLSYEEIAQALSLSKNTVKTFLQRARIKMRQQIGAQKDVKVIPAILVKGALISESTALISNSVIQQCAEPGIKEAMVVAAATAASAGIATTSAAATTSAVASTSIMNVILSAVGVLLVSTCVAITIVSAGANGVSGSPIHPEEQSVVEEIVVSSKENDEIVENSSLKSEWLPANSDSTTETESPTSSNDTQTVTVSISGLIDIEQSSESDFFAKDKNFSPQVILTRMGSNVSIAQAKVDEQGKYTLNVDNLSDGIYEVRCVLITKQGFSFSRENLEGKVRVEVINGIVSEPAPIYLVDRTAPTIAIALFNENEKASSVNPKKVEFMIGDISETRYVATVYASDEAVVAKGNDVEINTFLNGTVAPGKYTIEVVATDSSGNHTAQELEFYIT